MRRNRVKQALKRGEPQVGTWLSLINPMAGRFLSRLPFAWLTLDMEHSPYSWESAGIMLGQIADVDGIPLVRVPCADHQLIKRALDSGAHGVVVPMVMDRAQAEMCVAPVCILLLAIVRLADNCTPSISMLLLTITIATLMTSC